MTLVSAKTLKNTPWYLARRAGSGKISATLVNMLEKIMPAPSPCKPRKSISSVIPQAAPQSALAARKSATPAMMNHFLP
jgi:hypothetical protein